MHARARHRGPPRRPRGAALVVAMVLMLAVTVLGLAAATTSHMDLRLARNAEDTSAAFQTAAAAIDFVLADTTHLPATGPLHVPVPVPLDGSLFETNPGDALDAEALRSRDCAAPPRMRNATSMTAYSAFEYEIAADVDRRESGRGRAGAVQGYLLLGPKC
jgi:hypothetical protein